MIVDKVAVGFVNPSFRYLSVEAGKVVVEEKGRRERFIRPSLIEVYLRFDYDEIYF